MSLEDHDTIFTLACCIPFCSLDLHKFEKNKGQKIKIGGVSSLLHCPIDTMYDNVEVQMTYDNTYISWRI
jgi:hypothetical protein